MDLNAKYEHETHNIQLSHTFAASLSWDNSMYVTKTA
jgi:hypothetical protein